MSWLYKSLGRVSDEDDDISIKPQLNRSLSDRVRFTAADDPYAEDDFSVRGETLSRQLRGFANFLAPQPSPAVAAAAAAVDSSDSSSNSSSPSQMLRGIRNDLAEIGDGLRTGFSMLSVGNLSKFASNLLSFQSHSADEESDDEFVDDTPGITDVVLDFVTDISSRPEYWMEFPLALNDTDFKMSDVQRIHISTVEQYIPAISALKISLQSFMSNEVFWMIYFILLLPRFNQHDFELLSTPEIVEARNLILYRLQRKAKPQVNSEDTSDNNSVRGSTTLTLKENIPSEEKANSSEIIEGCKGLEIQDGENTNQGLEKADAKGRAAGLEGNSFSDLEEEDGTDLSGRFSSATNPQRVSSSSAESSDWVKLHENLDSKLTWKQGRDSEGGNSSDWLNVDEFD